MSFHTLQSNLNTPTNGVSIEQVFLCQNVLTVICNFFTFEKNLIE